MIIKNNIIILSETLKNIPIAPSKFNKFLYFIRNKKYITVLNFLKQFSNDRVKIIYKILNSVINNAIINYNFSKYNLIIVEAFINQSIIRKRKRYRAKGQNVLIQKKMSNLTIKIANI